MTSEPLDPCPVCGASVYTVGASGRSVECAGHIGHSYSARLADHRRLCAEGALARALEPEVEQFSTSHRLNGHAAEADEWLRLVARVREASK